MKFGMVFANAGPWGLPENAAALGEAAEAYGIESLWTVEHVVVPKGYQSAYPYSASGRMPGGEDSPIPDPLIWLSYVAARTSTVRLCTGVVILPQRTPLVFAKEVATLDVMSGGRVTLGVGVGWLEEEFDAIGVPFAERGPRTDDTIAALRAAWTQNPASHDSPFYPFKDVHVRPAPVQAGGIPIVIGGHSPAAARRAGRIGDGFFPARGDLKELPGLLRTMRDTAAEHGRDPDAIEVTTGGAMDLDGVRRYEDAGVHRLVIPPLAFDPAGLREGLARFHDDVISKIS